MSKGGRTFVVLTVLFALVCLTFIIRLDKGTIHLAMDQWHIGSEPTFFTYYTYLGDGLAFVAVTLLLLALRKPGAMVLSTAATGVAILIVVGLLKNLVFPDVNRPWGFFEEGTLRTIEGLKQHHHNSFPSGHTTAAFGLFGILAFWINKKWTSVLCFVLALGVGYSRMYLNQHFLIDVMVGSVLGTLLAYGSYMLFKPMKGKRIQNRLL